MLSEGMLCAATELNVTDDLYPSVGDAGLLIFNDEYPLGSDVKPILGLDDAAVDFEILANRPDCLCAMYIPAATPIGTLITSARNTRYRVLKSWLPIPCRLNCSSSG